MVILWNSESIYAFCRMGWHGARGGTGNGVYMCVCVHGKAKEFHRELIEKLSLPPGSYGSRSSIQVLIDMILLHISSARMREIGLCRLFFFCLCIFFSLCVWMHAMLSPLTVDATMPDATISLIEYFF